MTVRTVQIRKRGTITLPAPIRDKYRMGEGDPITLVDTGEGIFLSPKRSLLPRLAQEIEQLRVKHGVSTEELIRGVAEQRSKYRRKAT